MIALHDVTITAGAFTLAHISFTIPTGSYAVLMGESGAGKTTVLEAICGLRAVTGGRIELHEVDVTSVPPAQRGIGFVPQEGVLFPHLTVRENLALPLRVRGWAFPRQYARVNMLAESLGITPLLERLPIGLSGGERQRVALGRALSFSPEILILDEPLSALDADSHTRLCTLLQTIHRDSSITVLHVTHNQQEAETLVTQKIILEKCVSAHCESFPNANTPTERLSLSS